MDIDRIMFWLEIGGAIIFYLFVGAFFGSIKWTLGNYIEARPKEWRGKLRKIAARFFFPLSVFLGDLEGNEFYKSMYIDEQCSKKGGKEGYLNTMMVSWLVSVFISFLLLCITTILEIICLFGRYLFLPTMAFLQFLEEKIAERKEERVDE